MDDLSGLDWTASPAGGLAKPPPSNPASAISYAALRPIPSPLPSGRSTPLSAQGSGSSAFKPPATKAAQDSFSNLVNFSSTKSTANLSLRERQELLEAEKRRKADEKRKQAQANYGDGQFWDTLGQGSAQGSRTASPAIPPPSISPQSARRDDSDADLFASFNADTKVDNSSHFPPGSELGPDARRSPHASAPGLDLANPSAWAKPATPAPSFGAEDDDDPFGLSELKPVAPVASHLTGSDEDDDLLGDLGRPVEDVRREQKAKAQAKAVPAEPESGKPIEDSDSGSRDDGPHSTSNDPFDKAVAKIVDYGFTPENARRALTESGEGLNVQAAVNWLLDDAHRQAKERARAKQGNSGQLAVENGRSSAGRARGSSPAWMGESGPPGKSDNRSPAQGEGDFSKSAAAIGNNLLKSANSLWKTGQKKVQKAVAEFQQEGDPSQPKWMRPAPQDRSYGDDDAQRRQDTTDEAMLLEVSGRPGRRVPQPAGRGSGGPTSSRDRSPALRPSAPSRAAVPKWQQSAPQQSVDPRSRLNKQAIEEQSSQAYVSPARRKKTTPQPTAETIPSPPPREPEPDLLFGSNDQTMSAAATPRLVEKPSVRPLARPATNSSPRIPQSQIPTRQVPPLPPSALETCTRHRLEGTAHFKRGDFASAHASYTSAMSGLPQTHPLFILLLCNHALTALKTGEPRQAVDDADAAVKLIGPGRGEGETVSLDASGGETRSMKDLYGKALTRKAEALEQMEKWSDAGVVWQLCVESGVGGPTAIAGRQRCQNALAPKPKPKPKPAAVVTRPKPRPTASDDLSGRNSEAVERLRAANEAAQRADDEKFALVDKVDARIAAWRDGKRDNLRALLGSLDQVLWEGSGWKKVGLHELVVANKVKIVYMKAIAKCHPDKISQDASTEARMIAGTVFSTLNESWDKFKAENGL